MKFKLYVFGDNVEDQVKPFDENNLDNKQAFCAETGSYYTDLKDLEEDIKRVPVEDEDYFWVNPLAHFDQITTDGAWSDFFLLRDGTTTHTARIIDIDFAKMYASRKRKVQIKLRRLKKRITSWDGFRTLADMVAEYGFDKGNELWENQPQVVAIKGDPDFLYDDIERMHLSDSVDFWTKFAFSPYAYIKDGVWNFAKDDEDWYNILTNMNPNTTITVFSCNV